MNQDTILYIVIGLIALGIWAAILTSIISSATQAKKRIQQAEIQKYLLIHIALKLGVANETIENIMKASEGEAPNVSQPQKDPQKKEGSFFSK